MRESVLTVFLSRPVAFALAGSLFCAAMALPARSARDAAPAIAGQAAVVDGDTLEIDGQRIRLEGIDAPESGQTCGRRWLGSWDCGRAAVDGLEKLVGKRRIECQSRGHDKYGRMLGICYSDGIDINAAMVRSGLAWAFVKYSSAYAMEEAEARGARAGIWQGTAEPAWIYREKRWQTAETSAPSGCAIKGNISGNGRIYHMPWGGWYGKVKVEPTKGERWFCDEAEAKAAGFRPATTQ